MNRWIFISVYAFSAVCHAEIIDKLPSFESMWVTATVLGILFLLASMRFRLSPIIAAFVSLILASSFYDMYVEPSFRQAVLSEMGSMYFFNGYASSLTVFILSLIGLYMRKVLRS